MFGFMEDQNCSIEMSTSLEYDYVDKIDPWWYDQCAYKNITMQYGMFDLYYGHSNLNSEVEDNYEANIKVGVSCETFLVYALNRIYLSACGCEDNFHYIAECIDLHIQLINAQNREPQRTTKAFAGRNVDRTLTVQ